jgi:hypothetical protein
MSLTDWCNELRRQRIAPVVNVHFHEMDKKLYRNINFNSFTVNDVEEGWRVRGALANRPLVDNNIQPILNAACQPLLFPTEDQLREAKVRYHRQNGEIGE